MQTANNDRVIVHNDTFRELVTGPSGHNRSTRLIVAQRIEAISDPNANPLEILTGESCCQPDHQLARKYQQKGTERMQIECMATCHTGGEPN